MKPAMKSRRYDLLLYELILKIKNRVELGSVLFALFSWFLAYWAIKEPVFRSKGQLINLTGYEYYFAGILIFIGIIFLIGSFRK